MKPYYEAGGITIYHGDCREIGVWDQGQVMVTDPPYGRGWRQGALKLSGSDGHGGIANDHDTTTRDAALQAWAPRPALVFGDLMLAPPDDTRIVLIYRKPRNAGIRGAIAGFRRDVEAIYVIGDGWGTGLGGRSSVIATTEPSQGNPSSPQGRWHHPHAKPEDVMSCLIRACPTEATVIDPFMGCGSTLRAAKDAGRKAIGIEVEERYCEIAAKRMGQEVFDFGGAA